MSIQALRERKTEISRQANELLANAGDKIWSKEDNTKYDGLMDDLARVNAQIKAYNDQLQNDADKLIADAQRAGAGSRGGEVKMVDLLALYLRHGSNVSAEDATAIRNAMSTTTPAEGGYTVPAEVAKMVVDALKEYGGMRDVAEVLATDSGAPLSWPTSDGTGEEGEIVGENVPSTGQDITFGSAAVNPFKYSSKKIALPVELIQDSAIDVVTFVINRLAQRLARITNRHFTNGSGSAQPFGIVNRASSGKVGTTGQTATVIYDDLVDLKHAVNRAYRRRARWSMADASVKVVSKIKDTTGRPIFTPGYDGGITQDAPDMLLGYPITVNDDVPAMAANAKSILFGDHKQYVIRDVANSYSIRRFDDSAFALNGQVGFCGWMRTGGNLLDTAAVKYYQNSAT